MYEKAGKNQSLISGFFSLTPDEGTTYFYPYPNTMEVLPWRAHYGAGEYDAVDFGWTPPKAGHYKASFTGRIRASSSAYPALNLNYHVKDENDTNLGSIGCITVPSGMSTSYCVHAEFFFNVTDPAKKVYFSGYNAGGYPTLSGHLVYVNDASLTYEYLGE